jgi:hypothetical protein
MVLLMPVLQVYRHIVLAVHDPSTGLFGALGISRRGDLMYKPLAFASLAVLLADYQQAYRHATAGTLIMQQHLTLDTDMLLSLKC